MELKTETAHGEDSVQLLRDHGRNVWIVQVREGRSIRSRRYRCAFNAWGAYFEAAQSLVKRERQKLRHRLAMTAGHTRRQRISDRIARLDAELQELLGELDNMRDAEAQV